jgi:type IV pilus assembly protein PilV
MPVSPISLSVISAGLAGLPLRSNGLRQAGRRAARGFTMIEVLVTLVIMMFGLLGLAGLILKGHKASFEAYQRNQALIMVVDLAEKMKTNRLANGQLNDALYLAGAPVGAPLGAGSTAVPTACSMIAAACTIIQSTAFDLATWNNLLAGTQETSALTGGNVGGIINARGCIERAGAVGTPIRISIAWQGDVETVAPATSACGAGLYGTDGRRRVVSVDIL